MKKATALTAILIAAVTSHAQISVPGQFLLDDPFFTSTNSNSLAAGGNDVWILKTQSNPINNSARLVSATNTSVAGASDSFTADILLTTHSSVTNLPYYDVNKCSLESIVPSFDDGDLLIEFWEGIVTNQQPGAAQDYQAWYEITLEAGGTTYTGTSDSENMLSPTAASAEEMESILATAWNNLTWAPSDPFAGGGIPYTNITTTGIEFFYTNVVPITTTTPDNRPVKWNMDNAAIFYTVSIDAVDTNAPAAPVGLSASAFPQRVELDWGDNGEVDFASYNLYRSNTVTGVVVTNNLTTSSYSDSDGLVNGTTYDYSLTAIDFAGNESDPSSVSATPQDNPPSAPTGLGSLALNGEVQLDWDDHPDEEEDFAYFNVYRSLTSSSNYTAVASNLVESSFTDSNVVNGTTYYYVVTAVDESAQESADSAEVEATPSSVTVLTVDLLDDPDFTSNPDASMSGSGKEQWIYSASSDIVRYNTDNAVSTTNDADSFTAPINIKTHAAITNTPGYDPVTTTLDAIVPSFVADDGVNFDHSGVGGLDGSEQFDAWYIITLETSNGTYAATSDRGNFFGPGGIAVKRQRMRDAWNVITWDSDPFASGGIAYEDIIDISIVFTQQTVVANTTDGNAAFFFVSSAIEYVASVQPPAVGSYSQWAEGFGLSGSPDADPDYDYDNDGLDNLSEYGLNGNPVNGFNDAEMPTFENTGSGMEYVHAQRTGDPALTYYLETTADLADPAWTNNGYSVVATNVTGEAFDYVTNLVPTVDNEKYIRLRIKQN